ncbi:MAG: acetyl-CoA carboxylase biotin carboxyl carrier protein subunit [Clostridia bacterium]|jgi:biotin carboxyl carrier protein|nr:acetyl-CoA carboxylase biotin carboxyl carrier protein subunit [Clostridia bacterium]
MAELLAPMPGKVVALQVKVGDQVQNETEVLILESLKMEFPVYAGSSGSVKELKVAVNQEIEQGDVIAVIE